LPVNLTFPVLTGSDFEHAINSHLGICGDRSSHLRAFRKNESDAVIGYVLRQWHLQSIPERGPGQVSLKIPASLVLPV